MTHDAPRILCLCVCDDPVPRVRVATAKRANNRMWDREGRPRAADERAVRRVTDHRDAMRDGRFFLGSAGRPHGAMDGRRAGCAMGPGTRRVHTAVRAPRRVRTRCTEYSVHGPRGALCGRDGARGGETASRDSNSRDEVQRRTGGK